MYSGILSSFSPDFEGIQIDDVWLGSYFYENLSLDKNYAPSDGLYAINSRQDESFGTFAHEMKKQVMQIYDTMGLEMSYVNTIYCEDTSDQRMQENCIIETVSLLDGLPLIQGNRGDYARCFCKIGAHGVSRMLLQGIFKMESANPVSVMSLDETLKIIKTGVEEKEINAYSTITGITLAYMVTAEEEKNIFYPVWCFSTAIEDADADWPLLCVDAQTGHIVYMSP